MTTTFDLPNNISVEIAKTGRIVVVDLTRLPITSLLGFVEYGMTQKFNDGHSSFTTTGKNPFKGTREELVAGVHKKVDATELAMYAGTLWSRATVDPKTVAIQMMGRALGRTVTEAEYDAIIEANRVTAPGGAKKRAA